MALCDELIDPALVGRALGFDFSYDRECIKAVPESQDQLFFLVEYAGALVRFSKRLSGDGSDEFLQEFIFSSVRTHLQCDSALAERDKYWAILEGKGMSKLCLIELILNEGDFSRCGTIAH